MRITPLDVRKQEFRKAVRGFDVDEVNAFLATVADEYETVLRDNKQLRERILELEDKMSEYRTMEKTLRDTLMTAERVMNEAKDNADREADLIVKDAELRAQQALDSFRTQAEDLRREIIQLHQEREAYLARFRGLAEAQIQFIENHQSDFEDMNKRMMSMTQNLNQVAPAQRPTPRDAQPRHADNRPLATPAPPTPPVIGQIPNESPGRASGQEDSSLQADQDQAPQSFQQRETGQDEWRDYIPGKNYEQTESWATPTPSDQTGSQTATARPAAEMAPSPAPPSSSGPVADSQSKPFAETKAQAEVDGTDEDVEAERQADEVVEMLRPVDEEILADASGPGVDGAEPAPAETSDDEVEKPRRKWNMETFTRGLSDM